MGILRRCEDLRYVAVLGGRVTAPTVIAPGNHGAVVLQRYESVAVAVQLHDTTADIDTGTVAAILRVGPTEYAAVGLQGCERSLGDFDTWMRSGFQFKWLPKTKNLGCKACQ